MGRALQFLLVIILLVVVRQLTTSSNGIPPGRWSPSSTSTNDHPETAQVRVLRVVDGDTLLLDGGERVRLLGVNTPETKKPNSPIEPFGPEASDFTRQFCEGKWVTLVFDQERFDRYQRTLAFVYLGETCLNEELIRNGLSKAHLQYPFRNDMKRRLKAAEAEAISRRVGLWSLELPATAPQADRSSPAPMPREPVDSTLRYE
ncbi:thermonuclease family protein [Planctomicrobium sp. SH661]|uniref:thermonuclease family protein n=1 Tax=Planctomicrobium sp. SH661 TaxID=3448124 RepID=UPI003F5B12E1